MIYSWIKDWKAHLIFWGGALVVGLVSVGFAVSADWAEKAHRYMLGLSGWYYLATPLGFMLIAWITQRFFPAAQGSGIPQTIAALSSNDFDFRQSLLSFRIAVAKVVLTLMGFLFGASIGREGPTVHIGASILHAAGKRANFKHQYLDHGLILAGGAAGISAAFNTPIAGILFAIEEMARSYQERTSGAMIVAVVLSGVVTVALLGNYTYFGQTNASLPPGQSWIVVPVLGAVGGLLGGLFSRLLVMGGRWLFSYRQKYGVWIAGLCGSSLAILAWQTGGSVFGAGYEQAHMMVQEQASLGWTYPLTKFLATLLSYLSGIPGGIFAPSLSTGAGLGSAMTSWFPLVDPEAVIILGMVGYFAGMVKTPITAAVIVMEMVNDHAMVLPIMATALIAFGFSSVFCKTPIYQVLAENFKPDDAEQEVVENESKVKDNA